MRVALWAAAGLVKAGVRRAALHALGYAYNAALELRSIDDNTGFKFTNQVRQPQASAFSHRLIKVTKMLALFAGTL